MFLIFPTNLNNILKVNKKILYLFLICLYYIFIRKLVHRKNLSYTKNITAKCKYKTAFKLKTILLTSIMTVNMSPVALFMMVLHSSKMYISSSLSSVPCFIAFLRCSTYFCLSSAGPSSLIIIINDFSAAV